MSRPSSLTARVLGLLALCSFLPMPSLAASDPAPSLQAETCSVEGLMDGIRRGLGSKSEAYRKYLRTLLRESAVTLPDAELRAAFERETDPVMLEHLAAALVARTERGADPEAMGVVARRILGERDASLRVASLRALRRTSGTENTGDLYERLVRDASPEVREAAATNLIEDNLHVYSGHHGPAADRAVAAAAASSDPKVTARILDSVSTEHISAESADRIKSLLRSDDASVRAAAVNALGGVPSEQMAGARETLLAMYRDEPDTGVRKMLLQSIAQLGFAGAIPDLQRLRNVDPALAPEVDAWTRVLGMGLQEWSLILREKQRSRQAP
ncbi:HEAT repeat domain-containing protein [Pyxidicoccus fallax]|uniref:HEAT repeat domain-containing protein n=1 Tax=Pyxidicoccus fallax TaxID=394095 RepID=A0A848LIC0_9BACT|nr:HEAT repeat domain-containing protein [Pyxidicoccus fallax]NMO17458.1 HEAT repeat domain-containing protein [Pyxidicoccus fallax]NPC82319.1 HEAT repeat domain-containing protein [Pyxidicoccus fallax]